MHTSEYTHEGKTVVFHHNGDYSGDVTVAVEESTSDPWFENNIYTVSLPFAVIEEFVLDKLRSELVAKLEQAEGAELKALLGWK